MSFLFSSALREVTKASGTGSRARDSCSYGSLLCSHEKTREFTHGASHCLLHCNYGVCVRRTEGTVGSGPMVVCPFSGFSQLSFGHPSGKETCAILCRSLPVPVRWPGQPRSRHCLFLLCPCGVPPSSLPPGTQYPISKASETGPGMARRMARRLWLAEMQ